ncbi:MAG: hypothetical protein JWM74_2409, partial [Myxococcaceae bacterium]|nr:hypothetical protein [Myxococcaceae bacterium]
FYVVTDRAKNTLASFFFRKAPIITTPAEEPTE